VTVAGVVGAMVPHRRIEAVPVPVNELGATLRSWRDRLSPEEFGLPVAPHRRARGLRRGELARLAGVSLDYLIQLEQGRASAPSPQVLTALAAALRLTEPERAHLFRLADRPAPDERHVRDTLPPSVLRLVEQLPAGPAAVKFRQVPVRPGPGTADHRPARGQPAVPSPVGNASGRHLRTGTQDHHSSRAWPAVRRLRCPHATPRRPAGRRLHRGPRQPVREGARRTQHNLAVTSGCRPEHRGGAARGCRPCTRCSHPADTTVACLVSP
jgi:transcriptional regulator with XRE-family HTH domain